MPWFTYEIKSLKSLQLRWNRLISDQEPFKLGFMEQHNLCYESETALTLSLRCVVIHSSCLPLLESCLVKRRSHHFCNKLNLANEPDPLFKNKISNNDSLWGRRSRSSSDTILSAPLTDLSNPPQDFSLITNFEDSVKKRACSFLTKSCSLDPWSN